MGHNYCRKCGISPASAGSGRIHDPAAPWWMFWATVKCEECGGDGYSKPPGWPDEAEMRLLRPPAPPAPPRLKYRY